MTKRKSLLIVVGVFLTAFAVYYFYPEPKLPAGISIDKLVVYKSKRQLLAYSNGQLVKTYHVSLGGQPAGDKEFEGDKKTPEGIYFINDKNPNSGYHKNLGISYPNDNDLAYSKNLNKPAGGVISKFTDLETTPDLSGNSTAGPTGH